MQVTANHSIIVLDVSNGRLNGLTTLELPLLTFAHRSNAPSMDHLNIGIVGIHAAVAQIHECLFDFTARRFDQVIALANLRRQGVPIIRVANKALGAHHQALLVRDRQTDFNAEFVTVSGFAFADAFHLRRMQRVEFVFVLGLLCTNALRALQQNVQCDPRGGGCSGIEGAHAQSITYFSDQLADNGALPPHRTLQAFKLLGVGIAPGFPFKRLPRTVKRQRTIVGKLIREVRSRLRTGAFNAAVAPATGAGLGPLAALIILLERADRIRTQQPKDNNKLYALHAAQGECISKGKARNRYAFGVKVSLAVTHKQGLRVGATRLVGNPYDRHTRAAPISQSNDLIKAAGSEVKPAVVDWG